MFRQEILGYTALRAPMPLFTKSGEVTCWGYLNEDSPKNLKKVESIAIGQNHVICATEDGNIFCWNNIYPDQLPPADLGKVLAVDVGWYHGCAILQNHHVKCWGYNTGGATSVPGDLGPVKSLSLNNDSACAITMKGDLRCWGNSLIP